MIASRLADAIDLPVGCRHYGRPVSHQSVCFLLCHLPCTLDRSPGVPGDLDPTFAVGGKVFVNFGGVCQGHALVVQPDGKIIAAGQLRNGGSEQALVARFNVDGSLDPGFGTRGSTSTAVGDSAFINALALCPTARSCLTALLNAAPAGAGKVWDIPA